MPNNIKSHIPRLAALRDKLQALSNELWEKAGFKNTPEVIELIDMWGKLKDTLQDLIFLNDGIDRMQDDFRTGHLSSDDEIRKGRLERNLVAVEKKLKSVLRIEKSAKQLIVSVGRPQIKKEPEEEKKVEEKPQKKPETKEGEPEKKKETQKKPDPKPTPRLQESRSQKSGDYSDILKAIDKAIGKFNEKIPAAQRRMFDGISDELKRLDTSNGKIKTTVANLKVIQSIKNKLTRLIVTPEYLKDVKEFVTQFNEITKLQNAYWQAVEADFKPRPLLREIRKQAIGDTIKNLTASGIGSTISEQIASILRTNITTGGSYAQMTEQLREKILNTKTDGALAKYAKGITTDALNQYSAQYSNTVSSDLGFHWYAWQGSEIMTSRPFCQAMVENNRYFHISQVPNLLKGLDAQGNRLKYIDNKTDEQKTVGVYDKTDLPHGFIPGTNIANFFINRGGFGCGHQARPVSERVVPVEVREFVFASPAYQRWKSVAA